MYNHLAFAQVAKQAIQKLPGGLTVSKLSRDDSLKQAGALAALAGWALVQVWVNNDDCQYLCMHNRLRI